MTLDRPRNPGIPGDDAVRKATGRDWAAWFDVLDRDGGADRDHRGIVELAVRNGAGDWWAQMVSVAYEQARGKRALHQKTDGYAVSASRTIDAAMDRVFAAFVEPEMRAAWLPDPVEVTKATPGKSVRIRWADGSRVSVYLTARREDRTAVAVQHERIGDDAAASALKASWAQALDRLRARLEGS
jgi:uncharacterized protein YndB with AHSA1/START domain